VITYASRWNEIQRILAAANHLQLNSAYLPPVAQSLRAEANQVAISFTDDPRAYPHESPAVNEADTLQFFLLLGALSFCIWRREPDDSVVAWSIEVAGEKYIGARGLSRALVRALHAGKPLYDANFLQTLTLEEIAALFRDEATQTTTLQMLPERLAKLHELGRVLSKHYNGHVRTLFERSEGWLYRQDGRGVVQQLMTDLPSGFGDFPFAKLAQLTAKFLVGRRRDWIPTTSEFERLTRLHDLDTALDASADYYIPFFFLRVGLMQADERLLGPLARRALLPRDELIEQGYRAATLELCRQLAHAANLPIADLDTLVWKQGYLRCRPCRLGVSDAELPCPQRAHCRAFQHEPALMQIGWPLVHTTWY